MKKEVLNQIRKKMYYECAISSLKQIQKLFDKHKRKYDPTHLDWFISGFIGGMSFGKDFKKEDLLEIVEMIDVSKEAKKTGFRGRIDEMLITEKEITNK